MIESWYMSKYTYVRVVAGVALVLFTQIASSQVVSIADGTVVYGHHHINVTDRDEQRRFWVDTLGGVPAEFGSFEIVRFTNVILFVNEQEPTAGSKGSTVNHVGFTVPDLAAVLEDVSTAGFAVVTGDEVPASMPVENQIAYNETQDAYLAFVMAPDDIKIELIEVPHQEEVAKLHHIHFSTPSVDGMQAWYARTLGAEPGMRGNFVAADLPGVNLTFSAADQRPAPTKGRSLDHIGFEVDGLAQFVEELQNKGIVFDIPYRYLDELDLGIAFFTDPFGTYIELTEGLDRL